MATNYYFKKSTEKQFNKRFGGEYFYGEAMAFGDNRVEIKAIHKGHTADPSDWKPKLFIFKAENARGGDVKLGADPVIRDYDPRRDW